MQVRKHYTMSTDNKSPEYIPTVGIVSHGPFILKDGRLQKLDHSLLYNSLFNVINKTDPDDDESLQKAVNAMNYAEDQLKNSKDQKDIDEYNLLANLMTKKFGDQVALEEEI